MTYNKIIVTRKQLEQFLPDPQAVLEFERLIEMLNSIVPPTDQEASIAASIAVARSNEALDAINTLVSAIEALNIQQSRPEHTDPPEHVPVTDPPMLQSMPDVNIRVPRDLDLLQYSAALRRWESGALPWVDVDFPIIIRTTGPNIPTLVAINGNITMPQWAVNDFNMCESQEFIHGWKEGSEVFWHLHLTTNGLDVTNRYVRFEVEYGYVDVNGVWTFPAVLNSGELLIPANTPNETMLLMSLGSFTPAVHIGGHSVARLRRIASVGAAPTLNPWIPMLQQHIQLDTIGSRLIGTK
jgi:hypothetical protein